MTEIANRTEGSDLAGLPAQGNALPQTADVIQLQDWAAELAAAHKLGSALAQSSFLPMGLRLKGKNVYKTIDELTNDAAAVILAGKSVGLDPMQSVQNIFPVHGMPSMYARTMTALVMAEGHEVVRAEATDQSVTYKVRRKGSEQWQDFTWTIQRAQKAGYTANDKYTKDPIAMLGAKAAAEACRVVFPDVLLGMAYSVEDLELEDLGEEAPPATTAPVPESPKRKVARKPRAAAPAPDLPAVVNDAPQDEPEDEPAAAPAPGPEQVDTETGELPAGDDEAEEMATSAQIDTLVTALTKAGHTTKAAKSAAIADALGYKKSATELSAFEADTLIQIITEQAA